MSDEEKSLFEEECAGNPELKEQFEHTRDVKSVISERNRMLAKFQIWDDEYVAEKKAAARKRLSIFYWTTGIAAVFVVGYFLLPTMNKMELEEEGSIVLISQNCGNSPQTSHQPIDSTSQSKTLLAKNKVEKEPTKKINPLEQEPIFNFGQDVSKEESTKEMNDYANALRNIKQEMDVVDDRFKEINYQLDTGKIDENMYALMIQLLNHRKDNLRWRESLVLLKLNRTEEALAILRQMKDIEGEYKSKADSLYKEIMDK